MDRRSDTKENSPALWQIPPLLRHHHKYDRGHVALLGGATMTGAAKLAALAAQRAGAGVVTLASERSVWPIYAMGMMSVITRPLDSMADWSQMLSARKVSAVLLGPGAAPEELEEALDIALKQKLPLVLDAGALTALAMSAPLRQRCAGSGAILTPHAGEYEKLAASLRMPPDTREHQLRHMAAMLGCVVVLKGADTLVASPAGALVHMAIDAPWLATAGTGDVLAGIIAGLRAQGMDAFDAACAGVWLHGHAAASCGRGMVAEDLLQALPAVLAGL